MLFRSYTKDHEWVRLDGSIATIGITGHAQEALGDVVFVELPDVGRAVDAGEACAVVESVKAASDVYAPLSGTVTAANQAIVDDPAKVNADATGDGWFFKLEVSNTDQYEDLMSEDEYNAFVETES